MSLILYDGDCHFCSFWVKFVLAKDKDRKFQFAPLALRPDLPQTSIVVFRQGQSLQKSQAVLAILEELRFQPLVISVLSAIPKSFRDLVYDFIASRRYFFSKVVNFWSGESCPIPGPLDRERFIYDSGKLSQFKIEL